MGEIGLGGCRVLQVCRALGLGGMVQGSYVGVSEN